VPNDSELRVPGSWSARLRSFTLGLRDPSELERVSRRATPFVWVLLLAWVVARGWLSDDAAITARSVDNFVHGHGLRWNVDERVQVFTHPLWALLAAPPMAAGVPWHITFLGLGLGFSALSVVQLTRSARNAVAALAGLVALGASRAFADYSTSGLENPLANAVLVWMVARVPLARATPNDVGALSLGLSLLILTRHDLALLGLPVLVTVVWLALRNGSSLGRVAAAIVVGQLPLVLWEAFSLVYYGFLLPNTAYAKLNTGMGRLWHLDLGVTYFAAAVARDPWTLLAPLAFGAHAVRFRASPLPLALALGTVVYFAYVLWIGGDFMGGRFFVAPLICCVAVGVSRHVRAVDGSDPRLLAGASLAGLLCLFHPLERLFDGHLPGVADERAHNVKSTGTWALVRRGGAGPDNGWLRRGSEWKREAAEATRAVQNGADAALRAGPSPRPLLKHGHAVGMLGLAAGPDVHIVDHLAITEPFLARLPAAYDPHAMAGHFERMGQWSAPVPVTVACPLEHEVCQFWRDYSETLSSGRCVLSDRNACRYWEALRNVTTGALLSRERWRDIALLNLGLADGWIDRARYRDAVRAYPGVK
jgi:arabinofuranosyltransferase